VSFVLRFPFLSSAGPLSEGRLLISISDRDAASFDFTALQSERDENQSWNDDAMATAKIGANPNWRTLKNVWLARH
jgi:hypothetical protein